MKLVYPFRHRSPLRANMRFRVRVVATHSRDLELPKLPGEIGHLIIGLLYLAPTGIFLCGLIQGLCLAFSFYQAVLR